MAEEVRKFIAIDLKSFYASVECIDRELDPLTTNLVVADTERTEKTICLAVTPSLKAYGIPGLSVDHGDGNFGRLILGMSGEGVDIFVPKSLLEDALALCEEENNEEL